MATTYVFAFLLIPKYLLTKKYMTFVAYSVATIICSVYAVLMITFIIFVFLSGFNINQMPMLTRNIVFVLILVYLVVGLVSFVQVLRYNYKAGNRNSELENKLLEGKLQLKQKELHYLKQQIHPHFLFNTLNTLYGFALKESKETPELILKLSNLLDYILNQIDKPSVAISEEIKYIESYIGLEQVRFRDTLRVDFKKNIESEIQVPPMLFMAFVENAFKHGAAIDGFLVVEINLKTSHNKLQFEVKNTIDTKKVDAESHGLGLQNSKKRLDALYPDNYQLEVNTKENWHVVKLTINFDADGNI
jgi:sensor histidine kinase YesM